MSSTARGAIPGRQVDARRSRLRTAVGLFGLAELIVFVLVAAWIGVGATVLATLATSAVGMLLLARQGTRTLVELRERARTRTSPAREVGDAGLIALGGLLMVLPGFLGDLIGLLCLLPFTRPLPRALVARTVVRRLPDRLRGPVRVGSVRTVWGEGPTVEGSAVVVDEQDGAPRELIIGPGSATRDDAPGERPGGR